MSTIEWILLIVAVGQLVIGWQLHGLWIERRHYCMPHDPGKACAHLSEAKWQRAFGGDHVDA